ncbi:MAG: four helix bundle protein [Bacteroidales bacterium]
MIEIKENSEAFEQSLSIQKSEIIYDGTLFFCKKYLSRGNPIIDRMLEYAKNANKNIAISQLSSITSKKTKIEHTKIAIEFLLQLQSIYKEFSQINQIYIWDNKHPYSKILKELNAKENQTYETYKKALEYKDIEIRVNILISVIDYTINLLKVQLKEIKKNNQFLKFYLLSF